MQVLRQNDRAMPNPIKPPSLPDFAAAHVLVAGDVMLDRYWSGPTRRISPEAPVQVVQISRIEDRAGGAANVALGVRALGAQASLVAPVGDDEAGRELAALVGARGVHGHLASEPSTRTIVKLRVLSQHQQMIRLDFEDDPFDAPGLAPRHLQAALPQAAVVVLSDYGKGALGGVGALIAAARAAGKPVLVDPKRPDLEAYRGATLLTPNRAEFERTVGRCRSDDELVARGHALCEANDWHALLITRGEEGMSLLERGRPPLHIEAEAHEVYDVTGAGDTVIAVVAAALAAGVELAQAARLANSAAGVVVGKLGTATVSAAELAARLRG